MKTVARFAKIKDIWFELHDMEFVGSKDFEQIYADFELDFESLRRTCCLYQFYNEKILQALSGDPKHLDELTSKASHLLKHHISDCELDVLSGSSYPACSTEAQDIESVRQSDQGDFVTINGPGRHRISSKYCEENNWRKSKGMYNESFRVTVPDSDLYDPKQVDASFHMMTAKSDPCCYDSDDGKGEETHENKPQMKRAEEAASDDEKVYDMHWIRKALDSVEDDSDSSMYSIRCLVIMDEVKHLKWHIEHRWNKLVYYLLQDGAVECLRHAHSVHQNRFNKSFMDLAAEMASLPTFKVVADLCDKKFDGLTVARAAGEDNEEVVTYLLSHDCPVDNRCMSYACSNGRAELVRKLVERGVMANFVCISNACMNGHVHLTKYLLEMFHNNFSVKQMECLLENLSGIYQTRGLVLAYSLFKFISQKCISISIETENAASLAFCLWHMQGTSMSKNTLAGAVRSKSAMIGLVLHKTGVYLNDPNNSVVAARCGNYRGLVHQRLMTGGLDVDRCLDACRNAFKTNCHSKGIELLKTVKMLQDNRTYFGKLSR